jgi:hypothetical protein
VRRFGGYFNNTVSWLIAYAISKQPQVLGVYGVDMAQDAIMNAEYSMQRPSCEYFLGLAAGMGITLHLPVGSDLLKATHLYGFEDAAPFVNKLLSRLQEVGQRKEGVKGEMARVDAELNRLAGVKQDLFAAVNQLDGAMQDAQYWLRNWVPQQPGEQILSSPAVEVVESPVEENVNAS